MYMFYIHSYMYAFEYICIYIYMSKYIYSLHPMRYSEVFNYFVSLNFAFGLNVGSD